MRAKVVTPIKAYLLDYTEEELNKIKSLLTYSNTSIGFQYRKLLKNRWWKQKDLAGWQAKVDELKSQLKACEVFQDSSGIYVRPGSLPYLSDHYSDLPDNTEILINYPNPKPVPWHNKIPYDLYPYQKDAVENLLAIKHGAIESCTGSGKTNIIYTLARNLGLQTVILVPSASIFDEVFEKAKFHFGSEMVGGYGDGKKNIGKKITIGISKSFSNMKEGSKEWEFFSKTQVFLADEAHLLPAKSLEQVCHGIFAETPYRFFFSGTQTRGDGLEKLLQSITGAIVMTLSTKDAIAGGYICDHEFRIVKVQSSNPLFRSDDPLEMKRKHFLHNDNIAKFAAKLANTMAQTKGEQTLILVDEIDQIYRIHKLLEIPFACATGTKIADLGGLDSTEAIEKFNKGEVKVLIGTSCISTGTNIFPTHHTINWQGGSSEIKTKQGAVGRSVRKLEGSKYENLHVPKKKAIIWDFDVISCDIMDKQLQERLAFYKDSGVTIKVIG